MPRKAKAATATVERVHETVEAVESIELSPPHPPRIETPEYAAAHNFLINKKDAPCVVCGVRKSTLADTTHNPNHAKQLESHHYPIERSLVDACDPERVHVDFPQVYDRPTLLHFVDTPANLIVVCDYHHRSTEAGIHHLLTQDWVIQKYLIPGYRVAASAKDATSALATDEKIEQSTGIEQEVQAETSSIGAPAATPKPKRARKPRAKKVQAAA